MKKPIREKPVRYFRDAGDEKIDKLLANDPVIQSLDRQFDELEKELRKRWEYMKKTYPSFLANWKKAAAAMKKKYPISGID